MGLPIRSTEYPKKQKRKHLPNIELREVRSFTKYNIHIGKIK
jgi:desulfoferrodoxin (superoxide reductase-like protein)